MTVEQMRDAIADVYSSWSWKNRVANMPEDQVMAIYFTFKEQDMFSRAVKRKVEPKKKPENKQLSIFDFIGERK